MRSDRWLIYGGSIMLLAAFIGLLFSTPPQVSADGPCTLTDCFVTDTTLSDFVQGSFYATGLANIDDGAVQLLPMGLTSPWITDTYHLPGPRTELAAVIYHDIIYAIGGLEQGSIHSEIFSATTFITGSIKPSGWVTPTAIPTPLAGMSAVISPTQSGGILYVIGGYYQQGLNQPPTSTISYRSIDANGAFTGSWTNDYTALPTVQGFGSNTLYGLYYTGAVVRNGNLYVIGGTSDGNSDSPYVFHYPIQDANGTLGGVITETQQLPNTSGRHSSGVATWRDANSTDFLYVSGGQDGNSPVNNVPFTSFQNDSPITFTDNISDGLPTPLTAHGMVQGNGKLFLTGGLNPLPSNEVRSALIDTTGAPHYWSAYNSDWIVTTPMPQARSRHASVINSGGEVYVIGGDPTGGSGGTDTVYHGSTSGFGNQYAPQGNFLSRVMILGASQQHITSINIGSTITNPVTMTVQYRSGTNPNDFANPSTGWTNLPGGLQAGLSVTTSFGVSLTASLIQYRAFFTSSVSALSPSLNAFQVRYPPPPAFPDFAITRLDAPPAFSSPVTQTQVITYWVSNTMSPLAPVRRTSTTIGGKAPATRTGATRKPPPPAGTVQSKAPAAPQSSAPSYMFWVSFYADPNPAPTTPISVTNAITCTDVSPSHVGLPGGPYPPFIYYNLELYKTPSPFYAQCDVLKNTSKFYAQIDTCDISTDADCHPYGYVLELDEQGPSPRYTDNIIWAAAGTSGGGGVGGLSLFLPYIRKQ